MSPTFASLFMFPVLIARKVLSLWLGPLLMLFMGTSWAQAEFKVPALTGPVIDQVGYLQAADARQLANLLYDYNRQGKAQIQVLIIPDLQGEVIESASIKITDQWKLGDAKRDNGVLFLIAAKEHKLRIEVGQGLEGTLPDITAKHIISNTVTPYFKNGQMSDGVVAGVAEIIRAVDKEYADQNLPQSTPEPDRDRDHKKNSFPILLILVFILIVLSRIFRGGGGGGGGFLAGLLLGGLSGRGGGGFGGSDSGGGWSGGGGGFSGGGASGDW